MKFVERVRSLTCAVYSDSEDEDPEQLERNWNDIMGPIPKGEYQF